MEVAGVYTLYITNAVGCTFEYRQEPIPACAGPQFEFQAIPPAPCFGDDGQINLTLSGGQAPFQVAWYAGQQATGQSGLAYLGASEGVYHVLATDANGCAFTSPDIELEMPPPLSLWQPQDFLSCDTCLAPVARPLRTTTYQALLSDSLGCTAADAVTLFVGQRSGLYVPNAFSPNGDGRNDRLAVYGDASVETVLSFRLFNRWGALLFERSSFAPNDESLGWDGAARGQPAPAGAYVYSLRYRRADGREVQMAGEGLLVR